MIDSDSKNGNICITSAAFMQVNRVLISLYMLLYNTWKSNITTEVWKMSTTMEFKLCFAMERRECRILFVLFVQLCDAKGSKGQRLWKRQQTEQLLKSDIFSSLILYKNLCYIAFRSALQTLLLQCVLS